MDLPIPLAVCTSTLTSAVLSWHLAEQEVGAWLSFLHVPDCFTIHSRLAAPPTLSAVMYKTVRAQFCPCDPACDLVSVLTATFLLNKPW